jgi:hypothetical protein
MVRYKFRRILQQEFLYVSHLVTIIIIIEVGFRQNFYRNILLIRLTFSISDEGLRLMEVRAWRAGCKESKKCAGL